MSTKTTFKRIALGTVAALGFGLLSVVPASAATISSITVGTIPTARVGETVTIPITINLSGLGATTESTVIAAKVSSAPSTAAGQTATSTLGTGTTNSYAAPVLWLGTAASGVMATGTSTAISKGTNLAADNAKVGAFIAGTTTAGNIAAQNGTGVAATAITKQHSATASTVTAYLSLKPDAAGTYSVLVSATNGTAPTNPSFSYEAGVGLSTLVTITTGAAPSAVTLTNVSGTTSISGTYGALVKVSIGNNTLVDDEAINVTTSAGYIAKATQSGGAFASNAPTSSTSARLTKSDFVNGLAYVNVLPTSTTAVIVTATGSGALAAITNTLSVSAQTTADITVTSFLGRDGTVIASGWDSATACTAACDRVVPSTATSDSLAFTFADVAEDVTKYGYVAVVDTAGKIAGAPVGGNTLRADYAFSITGTDAATDTYAVVSIAHSASASHAYTATTAIGAVSVTAAAAVTTSSTGSVTAAPSNVRAATAGSVVIKALVKSQFNSALAGDSVTVSVSGRNGTRTSETLLTDSSGYVTTTITDAGTSGTTDVVTFTASGGKTGTANITWGTYTVKTVTVTGGKTASDSYAGQNLTSISTAKAGPDGASVGITATVKDSDGNILSGVPVTFSVSKGLIRKTASTDYTTVYTGTDGKATTYVIDWTEGTQTITATAGGVSSSDYLTWDQNTATSARSISGSASGNKVTATVKDRYGNTVKGVTVDASTSAGYFGTGSNNTTGTTAADGTVSFFVNGATGTTSVTLSLDKDTYTQSIDLAGYVNEAAVTAAVAGTTVGTGASLAAAGVNSVVVSVEAVDAAATNAQAATDAAAEATDAANAAIDAANAAAEAADAATAAAQDAADAVAALSAQVAALITGLKAQLTALTNLVIKIQKKVKA
jgi:hypothetical protein